MPVGPIGGSSSNQPFSVDGISGSGSNFRLGNIREQINRLNQKFSALKAGGQHDPAAIHQLEAEVRKLHDPLVNPKDSIENIDPEIKASLDKLLEEITKWKAENTK